LSNVSTLNHSEKMLNASQLTKRVAESTACSKKDYKTPSDHKPHAQHIKVLNYAGDFDFVLATFNVLNPKYVMYQSGVPPEGKQLPDWIDMKTQAGLEEAPSSDPSRQVEREKVILEGIKRLFDTNENVVLCIQECWPKLAAELFVSDISNQFEIVQDISLKKGNFCLTIISKTINYRFHDDLLVILDSGVAIANVHLGFSSKDNMLKINQLLHQNVLPWLFVVGDFNIQTRPLSKKIEEEGVCTATLENFANVIQNVDEIEPLFGVHPDGWTNWNLAKNCFNPEKNWDHFDNIMLLSKHPKSVSMEPKEWIVEMK